MWMWSLICSLLLAISILAKEDCDQKVAKCKPFQRLGPDEPSIFVAHAAGRLGNHLMAFAIVLALAKDLNIKPLVQGETAEYLKKYFVAENIPVFEETFCNHDDINLEYFYGDLDVLLQNSNLHRGKIIGLWPLGYKENSPVCCPADELMTYIGKTNINELKHTLQFKPMFNRHAEKIKSDVATELNSTLEDITFIGVHHRRTDHLDYMKTKFNKKPLKKSYFKEAMKHFREECETEKIAFLYISDDMDWGKTELAKVQKKHKDIFFVGVGKEETEAIGFDLATMASCDHTIISRGSFSTWCAILAGGEYYAEYGPIVTLTQLIDQQDKSVKRKKSKKKKHK